MDAGTGWSEDDVAAVLVNPFYAVNIAPSLFGDHEPLVSREQWVAANAQAIGEIGAERWLDLLLDVLESGSVGREG